MIGGSVWGWIRAIARCGSVCGRRNREGWPIRRGVPRGEGEERRGLVVYSGGAMVVVRVRQG